MDWVTRVEEDADRVQHTRNIAVRVVRLRVDTSVLAS